jgi:hypothetical protein
MIAPPATVVSFEQMAASNMFQGCRKPMQSPCSPASMLIFTSKINSDGGTDMNIDWAYLRKGWTSCKNAQEFLEKKKITADDVTDARKERINEDAAWAMLKTATSILIAKGKKFQKFVPGTDDQAVIMKQAMGPSGNLRAPTYRVGDTYIVGFNAELYDDWL